MAGTLNIDFEILGCSSNCKSLRVLDLTNYANYSLSPVYIDIIAPGLQFPTSRNYQRNAINTFNTNDLGLSDVTDPAYLGNIPDGIYKVCVRVLLGYVSPLAPNATPSPIQTSVYTDPVYADNCKYWLQDCELRCAIARKLLSVDLTCQPCRKTLVVDLQEIQLFLDAAQAQVENCNVNKAMEYFRRATKLLERLTNPSKDGGCKDC